MPSARLSFSTLNRVGRFLISILRTIVSSLRSKRASGTHDLKVHPALQVTLRPVLDTHGRMPASRALVSPTEALQLSTDDTEPHARTYRLHNSVRSHRTLRQPPPNGSFWDICARASRNSIGGAAGAAHHRSLTSRRMASPIAEQLIYRGRQAHYSLGRRPPLVKA